MDDSIYAISISWAEKLAYWAEKKFRKENIIYPIFNYDNNWYGLKIISCLVMRHLVWLTILIHSLLLHYIIISHKLMDLRQVRPFSFIHGSSGTYSGVNRDVWWHRRIIAIIIIEAKYCTSVGLVIWRHWNYNMIAFNCFNCDCLPFTHISLPTSERIGSHGREKALAAMPRGLGICTSRQLRSNYGHSQRRTY